MFRSSLISCCACLALAACSATPDRSPNESRKLERDLLLGDENTSLSRSLEDARPLVDLGTAD